MMLLLGGKRLSTVGLPVLTQ